MSPVKPVKSPVFDAGRDVFTTLTGRLIDTRTTCVGACSSPLPSMRASATGWGATRCATRAPPPCSSRGFNAKQVQVWLGHHAPSFTLDTYVHLLSDDLPESPFLGNNWATRADARERNAEPVEASEVAV